ncbi:MAG: hypothetical protein DSY43_01370 [Gammaproteobacteria bacterium]|nr:MAG: hypothetical protein DSY43_01370 [Gammaproteobacteria bacterium]
MSMKILITMGIIGSVLLTGCGGGSKKVIDTTGFDKTEGIADSKKGVIYLQEFLTANSASQDTVADLYTRLNIPGVEQAHKDGWTGKGKTVSILDVFNSSEDHGRIVSDIVYVTAPGITRNEFNLRALDDSAKNLKTMSSNVITTSSGYSPSSLLSDSNLNKYVEGLIVDFKASDALITVAAQHSNWSGTRDDSPGRTGRGGFVNCPNDAAMTVEKCNGWAVKGFNSNNLIYVGEVDSNNKIPPWSNQAGAAHKNQFIVTSSDYITVDSDGGAHGNSFSTPRVAGAGALTRHKFPNLSGSQTATIILNTADDLGVEGVDDVYGHGKLNIGAALAPIGSLH